MSAYKVIQTEYRNLESLKKACADLGLAIEVAPNPRQPSLRLCGHLGDLRPQVASLAVRRAEVNRFSGGASNDIGFAWDGQVYQAIVSQYDAANTGTSGMLAQIRQRYAYNEVVRQAAAKGYTVSQQSQKDGSISLVLVRR